MFRDRIDAGQQLAGRLDHLRANDVVVVGLPRGGVPVALEVAKFLDAQLDVIVVRKLGFPGQPEVGMGAIGEDGVRVIDREVVGSAGISDDEIARVEQRERVELERRAHLYRAGHHRVALFDRVVVVVDDGIATGSTAKAACSVARAAGARRIVLAVPVAPVDWTSRLADVADELICVSAPDPFGAVGRFYRDFDQTSDATVIECLDRSSGLGNRARTPVGEHSIGPVESPPIDVGDAPRHGPDGAPRRR